MARLAAFCRRLLAFVFSLFTAACGSGPRSFVDVESGDVHVDAAEVEGLKQLLAGSGLRSEQLCVDGEIGCDSDNWIEIDGDGHVWSVGLRDASGLDGLEVLSGLPRLTQLRIRGARLLDLRGLSALPGLGHLEVTDSGLASVAGLEDSRELRLLDLRGNALTSLEELPDLPELRTLDLFGNSIAEVGKAIAGRDRLEWLDLSYNALTTVAGIGELPHLERLLLSHNRLQSLAGLVGLPRLRELVVDGNQLSDASAVDALPALEIVNLSGNRLEEFPRLVERLQGYLWQDNPGTRRYWTEKLEAREHRERQVLLAETLPGGELDGSWSRGGCSWTGNRPKCSIRIPRIQGAGPVYLARFDPTRLTQDRRRHPVRVRLQLSVASGRTRAYLARRADGFPYAEAVPGETASVAGELFTSGNGVWFVLEVVDDYAADVEYRIEPELG